MFVGCAELDATQRNHPQNYHDRDLVTYRNPRRLYDCVTKRSRLEAGEGGEHGRRNERSEESMQEEVQTYLLRMG